MAVRPHAQTALEQSEAMIAPWASVLSQNAAKYAIIDFGQAAASWGAYRKHLEAGQRPGRHVGFPRFKRRRHEQGFRADNGPDTVRTDGRTVLLPKVGRVAMVEDLRFTGSIREVTVNRTAGVWFAFFASRTAKQHLRSQKVLQSGSTWASGPWPCVPMARLWRIHGLWPEASGGYAKWTGPSPAAGMPPGMSMARPTPPTDANDSTRDGFMPVSSTSGATATTRRQRR